MCSESSGDKLPEWIKESGQKVSQDKLGGLEVVYAEPDEA